MGAHVYGTVRNMAKGQKVVDQILGEKHGGGRKISLIEMDLSSFASMRSGTTSFLEKSKQLNLSMNYAGLMTCPFEKTVNGFESQFATNHLGHFLLFQLLKSALLASASPPILAASSAYPPSHTTSRHPISPTSTSPKHPTTPRPHTRAPKPQTSSSPTTCTVSTPPVISCQHPYIQAAFSKILISQCTSPRKR
jgi:NAD(P)-dependent dehydrogenase (short-subunit alcohol dehydrogenase family)